jgi:predicted RNA-binding Zn-ribbon protein involved in translation (DUF1610 family)
LTSFIIEHQCPQCGAPAELEETDRLFRCGYCRVNSYLTTKGVFRYAIPHHAPADKELIYFPYWRFKGMLFSCLPKGIEKRFVDVSQQAIPSIHFPNSVGFRSQTQKLHFATGEFPGRFLKPRGSLEAFLESVDHRFTSRLPKPLLHHEHIGETISLLYAPFYLGSNVVDAVLNEPLNIGHVDAVSSLLSDTESPNWPITFVPALCPRCGWDLAGQKDALALNCTNCNTLWRAKQGKLQELKAVHVPASSEEENCLYMPFWRIQADISHIQLTSKADLIKIANLPQVAQPGWEHIPFYFWSPAFKVTPQKLLSCSTGFTASQPAETLVSGPPSGNLLSVNMPLTEAVQSLKLVLADLIRPKERMIDIISDIQVKARRFLLAYLPFREGHHEFIHDRLNLAINKNMLVHSRNL